MYRSYFNRLKPVYQIGRKPVLQFLIPAPHIRLPSAHLAKAVNYLEFMTFSDATQYIFCLLANCLII